MRTLVVAAAFLCLATPLSARTLSGERLAKWTAARPAHLTINNVSRTAHGNPGLLTRYFEGRPDAPLLLPPNYLSRVTAETEECSSNIRQHVYRLRRVDPPVRLPVDLTWAEDPFSDPNWQLQFQRLNFVDCLMKGYVGSKDEWFIDRLKWVVSDWSEENTTISPANPEFAWYDHAIPIRMFNVMRAFEFLKRADKLDAAFTKRVLTLIALHADILADEVYLYRKDHNHGLDQSFRLLQAAHFFPEFKNAAHWREVALERIEYETDVAMTAEGIHRENTPRYHDGISTYIARIFHDMAEMGEAKKRDAVEMQDKALRFTTAMLRPDGSYPPLGDTATGSGADATYPDFDSLPWAPHFLYAKTLGSTGQPASETEFTWPESGYHVWRSGWDKDATQLVMKCGFLSTAHRHHDDGNILLYAFGEDWLIDTGMYGYPKKGTDEYHLRETAMQPASHNLTMPIGAKVQIKPTGSGLSGEGDEIVCRSPMFVGYDYQRHLSASGAGIVIRDQISGPRSAFRSIFRVPADKHIVIGEDAVIVWNADRTRKMTISYSDAVTSIRIAVGPDADPPAIETTGYRKARDARAIVFEYAATTEVRSEFSLLIE